MPRKLLSDICLTASDILHRKVIFDLRSSDIFAFGKSFGRAPPLPYYNGSKGEAFSEIANCKFLIANLICRGYLDKLLFILFMRHIEFLIDEKYEGKKVIAYLRGQAKLSARLVNTLKRTEKGITLNGEHIRTVDMLREGDILAVNIPEDKNEIEPVEYPLDIVFEDNDILVINKPAGLAMHPTHNHQGDTLANAVASYFLSQGRNVAFRAVGRLDKCTSGLVLCALNKYAAARLSGNFEKTYFALVKGEYEGAGTIDTPIYRPDPMKTFRASGENGDTAVTHWQALASDGDTSLMKITLETGRTHQIRVHFSSIGSPLCGDDMYGSTDMRTDRAALHCGILDFVHPVTGESLHFEVPLPEDMQKIVDLMMKDV